MMDESDKFENRPSLCAQVCTLKAHKSEETHSNTIGTSICELVNVMLRD